MINSGKIILSFDISQDNVIVVPVKEDTRWSKWRDNPSILQLFSIQGDVTWARRPAASDFSSAVATSLLDGWAISD